MRRLERSLVRDGSIPEGSASCLYVSAGSDTRPFTYLRPEVLPDLGIPDSAFPRLFVLVDKCVDPEDPESSLAHEDEGTKVIETDSRELEAFGRPARLSEVTVTSESLPPREVVVLRLKEENEEFAQSALGEGWSPEWFIGICDGCLGFGRNHRCENDIASIDESIPLRLGVEYWVTDHLRHGDEWLGGDNGRRAIPEPGMRITLPGGREMKELFAWRRWPDSPVPEGEDRAHWVCLYELDEVISSIEIFPRPPRQFHPS